MPTQLHKHLRLIGWITLAIAVVTWGMDWFGVLEECIYCRVVRTCIGVIAILMLLPNCRYFTPILTLTFGSMGAYVAAEGMFINIQRATCFNTFTVLAAIGLVILVVQVYTLCTYTCCHAKGTNQ